ncbi:MAG: hypothetical protein HYX74_03500 [Acidobacteria bacterium]|nr:hypothetical protein [Acidobacteriota bacterium]
MDWLLLVLVALTATGFILQGIALLLIASRLKTVIARRQKMLAELEQRANQIMTQMSALLDSLRPLNVAARSISDTVGEIVEVARHRTNDIDSFLEEMTQTAKSQAGKLDQVVTDTVQKFEETTATLQRDVLLPAMELSSLIKGIRAGFEYLFSRKKEKGTVPQDEEMFI